MRGREYLRMRRKYIIFGLIFSILLLGSSLVNTTLGYADEYDDDYEYNNEYNYSNEDNQYNYDYWKNYWENYQNQINQGDYNNTYSENQNNNNQDNQNKTENEKDDFEEDSGDDYEEKPKVDMTNVTLEKYSLQGIVTGNDYWDEGTKFNIKVNSEVVLNQYDNADVEVESSNEDMYFYADLNDNILTISTSSSGKTTLKLTINDKEFKIKVKITRVGFKENSYIIAKGKNEKIAVTGFKNQKVKWKSSKPDIVSVNQSGKVKGLKEGNAIITAEVNGTKLYALVSSVSEVKKKAVKWAVAYSSKNTYSQEKRMQKGYFDCSSLVWRAYNKFGHKLAGANYAPTAAELCKTYDSKKQTIKGGISEKNIVALKLLPGDLVFISGQKNGRYKNIYHVEMVAGYNFYGVDDKGHPSVGLRYVRLSEYSDKMTVARVNVK